MESRNKKPSTSEMEHEMLNALKDSRALLERVLFNAVKQREIAKHLEGLNAVIAKAEGVRV